MKYHSKLVINGIQRGRLWYSRGYRECVVIFVIERSSIVKIDTIQMVIICG